MRSLPLCLLLALLAFRQAPPGWPAVADGYRAALARSGIVGSSGLVVRDGQVIARAAEGLQDAEGRRPVSDDTIYHWASITKTSTGIAIRQERS